MAKIEVANSELRIQLSFAEKVLAFHGAVTVSLLHVQHAAPYVGPVPAVGDVVRFSGTYVPGYYTVGTERTETDQEIFYDVRDPHKAVAIDLAGDHYKRLIVEVDGASPDATASFINEQARRAQAMVDEGHRIQDEL